MTGLMQALPDLSSGEVPEQSPHEFQPLFDNRHPVDEFAGLFEEDRREKSPPEPATPDPLAQFSDFAEATAPNQSRDFEAAKPATIDLAEHEAIIEDLNKHHADMIEEVKQSQVADLVEKADGLRSSLLSELSQSLEESVGRALAPLAQRLLQQEALDQLVSELSDIIKAGAVEQLSLHGPRTMIEDLAAKFEGLHVSLVACEQGYDLTAQVNHAAVATKLDDWSERLSELLEC